MQEKTVGLVDVDNDSARKVCNQELAQPVIEGKDLKNAVIDYTPVSDYTTFDAEFAWIDDNLVIHFFLTPEMKETNKTERAPEVKQYWLTTFPDVVDKTAQKFFIAGPPRLQMKYTIELASWWFKAQGFADRLDPDAFALKFFEVLDQDLESSES